MKPKLERIKCYVEEEVIPHTPVIMSKLCITDISPKRSTSSPLTDTLSTLVKINRYQSIKKKQIFFYKPAYRILTIK